MDDVECIEEVLDMEKERSCDTETAEKRPDEEQREFQYFLVLEAFGGVI